MNDPDLGKPSVSLQPEGLEEQAQGSVQESAKQSDKKKTPENSQGGVNDEEDDPEFKALTELHNEMGVAEEKILKLTKLLGEIETPDDKAG